MTSKKCKDSGFLATRYLICSILMLASILGACAPANPIDKAERQWQNLNIYNYQIVVTWHSMWFSYTYQITVRDKKVLELSASCFNGPAQVSEECDVPEFNPDYFTIPGLFAHARDLKSEDPDHTILHFNAEYGFPSKINYDDPELIDEEAILQVEEFIILE